MIDASFMQQLRCKVSRNSSNFNMSGRLGRMWATTTAALCVALYNDGGHFLLEIGRYNRQSANIWVFVTYRYRPKQLILSVSNGVEKTKRCYVSHASRQLLQGSTMN